MSNRNGINPNVLNLLSSLDAPVGTSYRDQWKARQDELAAEAEALANPVQSENDDFFQRSASELAGDLGSGLAKGVNSAFGAIVQTADASVELNNKFNPLMSVMRHYFPERVAESEKLYTNVAEGAGNFFKSGEDYWQDKKSKKIQDDAEYVSGGESFFDAAGRAIERPQVIPDLVADSAVYMLPGGWAARALAATGATKTAVTTGSMGVGALLDAGATGMQAKREALQILGEKTPEQLMVESPDYKALRDGGISHKDAVLAMGRDAGFTAQAIQLPISFLASKFTGAGKIESDFFTGQGVKNFFSAIARETAEEGIQESSAQVATNIGIQQNADETRSLTQDVGKNAALGMIAGGAQAGGMKALGAFVPGSRGTVPDANDDGIDDGMDSPTDGSSPSPAPQLQTNVDTTTHIPSVDEIGIVDDLPPVSPLISTGDQSNPDDRFKFELNTESLRSRIQNIRAKRREEMNRVNRTVDFTPVEIQAAPAAAPQNIDAIEFTPPALPESSRFSLAPLEQSNYENGVDFTPQSAKPSPDRTNDLAAGVEQAISKNIDSARNARMPENLKDTRLLRNRYRTHLTNVAESLDSNAGAFSSPDSLLEMAAKNGGLNAAAWASEGIDPADAKLVNNEQFAKAFRQNGGMTPDDLAEFAAQRGFSGFANAQGTPDANAALNAINEELAGKKRYSSEDETALQAAQSAPAYISELKEFGSPETIKRAITLALEGKKLGENQLRIVQEVLNNTNTHSRDDKTIKEKWADRAKTMLANRGNKELNSWRNRDEHEAGATTHEAALNEIMTDAIENYGIDPDAVKNAYRTYAEKYPTQGQLTAAMTSWVSANKPNTSEHLSYEQQNRKAELSGRSSSQRGEALPGAGLSLESQGGQEASKPRSDAPSPQAEPRGDSAGRDSGLRQSVDSGADENQLPSLAEGFEKSLLRARPLAKKLGIPNYNQMKLAELVPAIKKAHQAESDAAYVIRNKSRIDKINSAKSDSEIDAIVSDEYSDSSRWSEATSSVENAARSRKRDLIADASRKKQAENDEKDLSLGKEIKFEIFENTTDGYKKANKRIDELNKSGDGYHYGMKEFVEAGGEKRDYITKRKIAGESKQEAKTDISGDAAPATRPKEVHLYTSNKDYSSSKKYFKRLKAVNGWGLYQDPYTNDYILLTETYKTDKFSSIEDAVAFAEKHQTVSKLSYMDAYNKRLMPSQPETQKPRPSDGVSVSEAQENEDSPLTTKGTKLADKAAETITDFGEKLEGAKKDTRSLREKLSDKEIDTAAVPLSKSFPQPDYEKLAAAGVPHEVLAFVAQLRAEIKAKPKRNVRSWAATVDAMRSFANDLLDGSLSIDDVVNEMKVRGSYVKSIPDIIAIAKEVLPSQIKDLGGYKLERHHYTLYRDQENVFKWVVTNTEGKAGEFRSSRGNESRFDTKDEALAFIKSQVTTIDADGKPLAKFDIWSIRGENGYWVGKKLGTNKYIELKKFDSSREARDFIVSNNDELSELLKRKKQTGSERRAEQNERVGKDYRRGVNVTQDLFNETFGFRGVQFGTYVNNDKRQQDLNNAYDGLLDLADVLGIPPQAISLNGELGLAFGARGNGGKDAASAHYESKEVVINLTKANGAGSLAHEWWHALDNYFAKQGELKSKDGEFITELNRPKRKEIIRDGRRTIVDADPNDFGVRPEVYDAFKNIVNVIKNETKLYERSNVLDGRKTVDYWTTTRELTARTFERFVIDELKTKGYESDYLASILPKDAWDSSEALFGNSTESYPYPTDEEAAITNAAYSALFDTIESKQTEKGTLLYKLDTKPSQVETPSFKKWFGDSKVVDADGKPLVVYHGTDADFSVFNTDSVHDIDRRRMGAYFSANPKFAKAYGGDVVEAYLSIRNPLDIRGLDANSAIDSLPLDAAKKAELRSAFKGNDYSQYGLLESAPQIALRKALEDAGYDGIAYTEGYAGAFVVFHPEQIKSATGNNGDFDPANPDIRYKVDGAPTKSISRESAQAVIDKLKADWKGHADVRLVQTLDDLPSDVRQRLDADGKTMDKVQGIFHPKTGIIYLNANKITSKQHAKELVFHEAYTHLGLTNLFGKDVTAIMGRLYLAMGGQKGINDLAAKHGIDLSKYEKLYEGERASYRNAVIAEELLAHISESPKPKLVQPVKELIGAIRAWLRKNGFAELASVNDADIAYLLKQSRETITKGKASDTTGLIYTLAGMNKAERKATNEALKYSLDDLPEKSRKMIEGKGLLEMWGLLAQSDEAFKYPTSDSKDIETVFREVAKRGFSLERQAFADKLGRKQWAIMRTIKNEETGENEATDTGMLVVEKGDEVWLNVALGNKDEGGSALYAALGNYAYNAGKVFIGDPNGLSPEAVSRRLENMISLALKFGTTKHIRPHAKQVKGAAGVDAVRWIEGADSFNLRSMIAASYKNVLKQIPEIEGLRYDVDKQSFVDENGNELTSKDIENYTSYIRSSKGVTRDTSGVVRREGIPFTVGGSTVRRAVLTNSFLRGSSEEQSELLASMRGELRESSPLREILYSLDSTNETRSQGGFSLDGLRENEIKAGPFGISTDGILRVWQDKMRPLLRTQNAIKKGGGQVSESENAYLAEEAFHGKTENDLRKMRERFLEPMSKKMADNNIEREELDMYLWAKHAEERNAQIAKINEDMPDGGSGMTNAQARQVIKRAQAEGKVQVLEDLAETVYSLLAEKRKVARYLAGDDVVDTWNNVYKFYVPLKGRAVDDSGANFPRVGRGFDIRGSESLRALGRRTKPESPTLHAIKDTTEAIIRYRKNEVGNALLALVEANPNPEYWEAHDASSPDFERKLLKKAGKEYVGQAKVINKEDYFITKREGKEFYIRLEDPMLLRAMKNMGPEKMNWAMQHLAKASRFLSAMCTSYNPEFVITNFARDIQTAIINLQAEIDLHDGKVKGKQITGKMIKGVPFAMRSVYASLKGKRLTGDLSEWQKYFDDFRNDGANTGWFQLQDIDQQADELETLINSQKKNAVGFALRLKKKIGDFVANANGAVESAIRLSVYKSAIEAGVSRKQAASLAKNLTVNFNRKGEIGASMNAAYMFFNAAVQGTASLARALGTLKIDADGKRSLNMAQKVALGVMVAAFGLAVLNRSAAGDDDDDENWWDKVPAHEKERNIIIMKAVLGGPKDGTYWKIPLPYGYNIFNAVSVSTEGAVNGKKGVGEASGEILKAMLDAFSPIGVAKSETLVGGVARTLAPTVLKPLADLTANENFFGSKIFAENMDFDTAKPNSHLSMRSTNVAWKWIAEALNDNTGGSAYRSGVIDISPDKMGYIFNYFVGSAGAFYSTAVHDGIKLSEGREIKTKEIPFVRRLSGAVDWHKDQNTFYERKEELEQIRDEYKSMPFGAEKTKFLERYRDEIQLAARAKVASVSLSHVRKQKNRINDNPSLSDKQKDEALDPLDLRMKGTVDRFNALYSDKLNR